MLAERNETCALQFHNRTMHRAVIDMSKINKQYHHPRGMTVMFRCGEPGKTVGYRETVTGLLTFTTTIVTKEPVPDPSNPKEIKARVSE